MIKLTVFTLIFLGHLNICCATIHTLCNMPYSPGMYASFDAAHTAAADGDTIYVQGSNINYGDINVYKALVIIGTGHHPNKQNALLSSFQTIRLDYGSIQLIGLTFKNLLSGWNNITIKKCRIIGSNMGYTASMILFNGGDGWLIEGNIFEFNVDESMIDFQGHGAPNAIIRNNIFSNGQNKIKNLWNSGAQLTYIFNNVFLGNNTFNTFEFVQKAVIDNNIFIASNPTGGSISDCEMNNNISYACGGNNFTQPGLNNLAEVDPEFISFPGPGNFFSYNYDFRLTSSSPGHNTALDGTDRGIFGGVGFRFSTTGEPSIAEITAFTITSPTTIPPNGTLNVSITSKRIH